jgi:hypothetical protein
VCLWPSFPQFLALMLAFKDGSMDGPTVVQRARHLLRDHEFLHRVRSPPHAPPRPHPLATCGLMRAYSSQPNDPVYRTAYPQDFSDFVTPAERQGLLSQ